MTVFKLEPTLTLALIQWNKDNPGIRRVHEFWFLGLVNQKQKGFINIELKL